MKRFVVSGKQFGGDGSGVILIAIAGAGSAINFNLELQPITRMLYNPNCRSGTGVTIVPEGCVAGFLHLETWERMEPNVGDGLFCDRPPYEGIRVNPMFGGLNPNLESNHPKQSELWESPLAKHHKITPDAYQYWSEKKLIPAYHKFMVGTQHTAGV